MLNDEWKRLARYTDLGPSLQSVHATTKQALRLYILSQIVQQENVKLMRPVRSDSVVCHLRVSVN